MSRDFLSNVLLAMVVVVKKSVKSYAINLICLNFTRVRIGEYIYRRKSRYRPKRRKSSPLKGIQIDEAISLKEETDVQRSCLNQVQIVNQV